MLHLNLILNKLVDAQCLQQYEKFRSSVASHFSVCVFDLAAANIVAT